MVANHFQGSIFWRLAALILGGMFFCPMLTACAGGQQGPSLFNGIATSHSGMLPAATRSASPCCADSVPVNGASDPAAGPQGTNQSPNPASSAMLTTTTASTPVSVLASYVLPQAIQTALDQRSVQQFSKTSIRSLQYISASNTQVTVTVTPIGGSPTVYGPTACTTGSCAISFTANPGPVSLAFKLTDSSSNTLSTFSSTVIVEPIALNTFSFSANPVVASVLLQLASTSVTAGTANDIVLAVNAKDADGNIIVGTDNYIDSTQKTISLSLTVSNTQSGGAGSVTLKGPTRISSPNAATTTVHYNGLWLSNAVIGVSTNSTVLTTFTPATLTITPHAVEYSTGLSTGANPNGIAAGPDGNLWVAEYGGGTGNKVAKVTPSGTITEYSTGITASAALSAIISGPDGNLWFTEQGTSKIGRITLAGTVTEFTGLTGTAPAKIIVGPDGRLWFTESVGNKIGAMATTGTLTEYAVNTTTPRGLAVGLDGNIWITGSNSSFINQFIPPSTQTHYTYSDPSSGWYPDGLALGSDQRLWFASNCGDQIYAINTLTGTLTQYTTGLTANAGIQNLALGPDGNIWFTEAKTGYIGNITPAGTVTEYGTANGITAAGNPAGIVSGPDGNIWFTEYANNKVTKFVL